MVAPLVVSIPGGAPTGQVSNPTTSFVVHDSAGHSAPARFLFEDCEEKVLLAPEVGIERSSRIARLGRDILDAGGLESVSSEHASGCV